MQWIIVAKVQWNFFVFKTSLAGIMILYLLVMAQRPSPLGTNVETSEVESVILLSLYSSNDIHFSDCSSLLHAIIQQTQITILL